MKFLAPARRSLWPLMLVIRRKVFMGAVSSMGLEILGGELIRYSSEIYRGTLL